MTSENRRQFLQKFGFISLAAGVSSFPMATIGYPSDFFIETEKSGLASLLPGEIFSVLNIDSSELAKVKEVLNKKGYDAALAELLKYYRIRYPKPAEVAKSSSSGSDKVSASISRANNIEKHIFQWGPYDAADYGSNIDWAADPAGDIEWVASVYRFYWANDLVNAYLETGDERYASIFVELTTDWIGKHPLEKTIDIVHPVYKAGVYGSAGWKGYPWLDLQTGIRATNICKGFRTFVHTKAFTPSFLAMLIASLYDHQLKTEKMPMNKVHNKAIFEQRGFFNVMYTLPEYKDREKWLDTGIELTSKYLLAQTTADGVQREWCGGYHTGVYNDALEIENRTEALGRKMPLVFQNRIKLMADHFFGISTPDLGFPMFGDTSRNVQASGDRKSLPLYDRLLEASEKFNDPKYKALADLDIQQLPSNGSTAFSESGLYAMRNKWTPDQVYMALHCSPPAFSSHDTPDNGTFEIYGYGRWLMPDTGFYTYGNNLKARAWHRQTKVHATLTLNGEDTMISGRQLLWNSSEDADVLCVENHSYRFFLHRRTVWFLGKKSDVPFFVILDEAIGDGKGDIAIHFPIAPGPVTLDNAMGRITTGFDDSNLMIQVVGQKPISLEKEEGWYSKKYGEREKRTSVSAVYKGQGPFAFVSVLVPHKGKKYPDCRLITDLASLYAGGDPVELEVEVDGKKWTLERKLHG